jgi:hypothetical protein
LTYTNQQLNTLYSYLGFNFYLDFDPNIKSMIIATQAVADGGTQPDDTLQLQILNLCDQLAYKDQQLLNLSNLDWINSSSTGAMINPAMGDFLLRRQGRALIKQLCIILALKGVRADYYGRTRTVKNEGISYFPNDDY